MAFSHNQHTLKNIIHCSSIGLHSGAEVKLRLMPAQPGSGILFRRMDIDGGASERSLVPARYDLVSDTLLGTTIENEHGVEVATVEHLMAALWGSGLDNVMIEIHGPEVPIMDGSSAPFMALIEDAGVIAQPAAREVMVIDKPLTVQDGASRAELLPYDGCLLDVSIDFPHEAIAHQQACYDFSAVTFAEALGRARTFGFAAEVEKLRAAGLARGGSLDNAIVIGDEGVMNEEGLRFDDEFVRHKALDCLGDYFLAGYRIWGKVVTSRPGHSINNKLMHALFNAPASWHLATMAEVVGGDRYTSSASGSRRGIMAPADALMVPPRS